MRRKPGSIAVACAALVASLVLLPGTAWAASNAYGTWTVAGANPSWTGTLAIGATGFPSATFATNSNTPSTATAAFLNASTPFGAAFGTSSGSSYLTVANSAGGNPSVTTFTFANPTPASGWGFAFGDVDADQVQVQASGPAGPLPVAQLGFQSTFNYCTTATPRPASCGGTAQTDLPTWNAGTATLVGGGTDTNGVSGWFKPTAAVTTLTLTYTKITGIPSYQIWVAANTSDVAGTVAVDTGPPTPASTGVRLVDGSDTTIATTTAAPNGSFAFPGVVASDDTAQLVPPPGYQAVGPGSLPVAASTGDVAGVNFTEQVTPPPTTTTTSPPVPTTAPAPTTTAPTTSTTTAEPAAARGTLPATGKGDKQPTVGIALALMLVGLALTLSARRRPAL